MAHLGVLIKCLGTKINRVFMSEALGLFSLGLQLFRAAKGFALFRC